MRRRLEDASLAGGVAVLVFLLTVFNLAHHENRPPPLARLTVSAISPPSAPDFSYQPPPPPTSTPDIALVLSEAPPEPVTPPPPIPAATPRPTAVPTAEPTVRAARAVETASVAALAAAYFPEQPAVAAAKMMCESGGQPGIIAANGHYGLWQFSLATWRAMGGSGLPSDASAEEQTARARALYDSSGWGPWQC